MQISKAEVAVKMYYIIREPLSGQDDKPKSDMRYLASQRAMKKNVAFFRYMPAHIGEIGVGVYVAPDAQNSRENRQQYIFD